MTTATLPRDEKMKPFCRCMSVGDSVLVPFKRYSYGSIRQMLCELKYKEGMLFEASAKGRLTDCKVTRLR